MLSMKKTAITHFLIGAVLIGMGVYWAIKNAPPQFNQNEVKPSASIDYPSEFNFRQTINDCGPFNVAAVVRTLTQKEVNSVEFATEMEWRLPNKYTLPWGLEKQLRDNGINIQTPNLKSLSDQERIEYLQKELSLGHPIILLGEREKYEHYVTLLGYDQSSEAFYIYDSLMEESEPGMTVDENGEFPGNRNYSDQELLDFWSGSGMYGLYKWYVIVASTD